MSGRRRSRRGRSVSLGSGGLFVAVLVLAVLSWPLALGPLVRLAGTLGWQESECTIVSSEWRESTGARLRDRSSTLEVRYSFEVDGRTGEGTAINVTELDGGIRIRGEGGRHRPRSADGGYVVGGRYPCWVQPSPPYQAVLERSATGLPWLLSGVLAILLLAALGSLMRPGR